MILQIHSPDKHTLLPVLEGLAHHRSPRGISAAPTTSITNPTTIVLTQLLGTNALPDEGTPVVEAANAVVETAPAVFVAPSGPALVLVSVAFPQYAAIPSAFLAALIPAQVHLERGWPGPAVVPLMRAPVSVCTQKHCLESGE